MTCSCPAATCGPATCSARPSDGLARRSRLGWKHATTTALVLVVAALGGRLSLLLFDGARPGGAVFFGNVACRGLGLLPRRHVLCPPQPLPARRRPACSAVSPSSRQSPAIRARSAS